MKTDEHTGTHDQLYTFAIYAIGRIEESIRTGWLGEKIEATDDSPRKNNAARIADNIDAIIRTLIYHRDTHGYHDYLLHELEVVAFDIRERTQNQQLGEAAAHLRHALTEPDHIDADAEQCRADQPWSPSSFENPNV